jgi:hypothetical protein
MDKMPKLQRSLQKNSVVKPLMPANFDQVVKSLDRGQVKLWFNSFFWDLVMCWQKLTNA